MNSDVVGFLYDDNTYYYKKNVLEDVVGIMNEDGKTVARYEYDAWGNAFSISGDTDLAKINPFRYRSYYYDEETGFYYLLNRYYDSVTRRMLNADSFISVSYPNLFAYALNNPIKYGDASGNAVETIVDLVSIGWSFIELITRPSWINLGFLAWDVASVFIPYVPGSYVVRGGKKLLKVANTILDFKTAKYLTIGPYSKVKKVFKGVKAANMMSVPMTKSLHNIITQRWRKEFAYGGNYKNITKGKMKKMIEKVYYDMPALKKYALLYLEETWVE